MSKLTFSGLYTATKEAMHLAKEPLVKRKNERAVASAIDSATDQKMKAEEQLEKELHIVSEGGTVNVNNILEQRQLISNADATIKELETFKTEFFS